MKSYFYPKSLYTSIAAFSDLFNDMSVRVYDKTGKIVGVKPVPVTLAPKEKIAALLLKSDVNDVDPQVDNYLPRMSINMTGITWDSARMRGKYNTRLLNIEYLDKSESPTGVRRTMQVDMQPVPYNLTFEVTLWAKYDTDMRQLQENILPWFAPESFVSVKERNFGIERKSKVTMDSVNINNVYELDESTRRVLMTNLSFTMETVVYKPMELKKEILCSIISIADVPCKRTPFEGDKIITTDIVDSSPMCLDDRDISSSIQKLDSADGYDLMVNYWRFANNTLNAPMYTSCINNCQEPIGSRPTWNPSSGYSACDPPIKKPYIYNNPETGIIEWYFQTVVTGQFKVPDSLIEGYAEADLPELNVDGTRTFGTPDVINVWHFKRLVSQSGETVKDVDNREMILLVHPSLYPEAKDGSGDKPQDIPQDLNHLAK